MGRLMHGSLQFRSSPIRTANRDLQSLYGYGRAKCPSSMYQPTTRDGDRTTAQETLPRNINFRFGNRLRELRLARNMTQLHMAVEFGIDRSFISDVERGQKSISLVFLEVIALGMKIELADLVRGL